MSHLQRLRKSRERIKKALDVVQEVVHDVQEVKEIFQEEKEVRAPLAKQFLYDEQVIVLKAMSKKDCNALLYDLLILNDE